MMTFKIHAGFLNPFSATLQYGHPIAHSSLNTKDPADFIATFTFRQDFLLPAAERGEKHAAEESNGSENGKHLKVDKANTKVYKCNQKTNDM